MFVRIFFLSMAFVFCIVCGVESQSKILSVDQFRKQVADLHVRFEDYKTTNTFSGLRRPPILDTPFKHSFRTVLTKASKGDPNFDGKYVVASWDCGTSCQHFAIIDLEAGIITDGRTTEWGQVYRVDSSLLIVNDPDRFLGQKWEQGLFPSWVYTQYYRWNGTELLLLTSINR